MRESLQCRVAGSDQPEPIMTGSNIHYEMSEKTQAINCGGIGAIHTMVNKTGLRQEIDKRLHLLKRDTSQGSAEVTSACPGTARGRPRSFGFFPSIRHLRKSAGGKLALPARGRVRMVSG